MATAVFANRGTLFQPKIVSQARDFSGKIESFSSVVRRDNFVSQYALNVAREGMRLTVTEGTAQQLKDLPVAVAGKTGTAQFGTEEKTHGWFESFAPYEDPEIVLVVMIEDQGKEDTYNAVPITHDVLKWYFEREGKE
jgi:cell division protein FtsI/penicillin-binding protein 2